LERTAALYLAHLNPVTKAHETIISKLSKEYNVYVYPVIFRKHGTEINTRTFPFSYELRKEMLKRLFEQEDNIRILSDYFFESHYIKYLPPFISPYSWTLRKQILKNVKEGEFISYTGDLAERVALSFYNLHPVKSKRLDISATRVKDLIYQEAIKKRNLHRVKNGQDRYVVWEELVPQPVVEVIKKNWDIIEKYADMRDRTVKIMGMKFPAEGILHF